MYKFILPLVLLAGCATTRTVLNEPDRTVLYVQCLMAQQTVTYCECIEQTAMKNSGITKIDSQEVASKFVVAVNEVINSHTCEVTAEK